MHARHFTPILAAALIFGGAAGLMAPVAWAQEPPPRPTLTPEPPTATPEPTAAPSSTPRPSRDDDDDDKPTATPEPTATVPPTATPEPSATVAPTAAPEPSATPAPTPVVARLPDTSGGSGGAPWLLAALGALMLAAGIGVLRRSLR